MPPSPVGLLLAGGASSRFGSHKLLHPLSDGTPMALAALRNLTSALPRVIAIVRRGDQKLRNLLATHGAHVVECAQCQHGIAYSIAAGVRASADASGWVVALADMPGIEPTTISAVKHGLQSGDGICLPVYKQQRGHPVGFAQRFFHELISLEGDVGGRKILERHPQLVTEIACNDAGVLIDIDTPADLSNARTKSSI